MPPRFDDDARTLRLSVADLLHHRSARHLGFANRGGFERLWVGQAIHSRYQERAMEREPSYRREVELSLEFGHRGWQVTLTGRADGVYRDAEGVLAIEEIKSVRPNTDLSPGLLATYRRQAAVYAWIMSRSVANAPRTGTHRASNGHAEGAAGAGAVGEARGAGRSRRRPGNGFPAIRAELVLIEIGAAGIERLEVELDWRELEIGIRARLNALVQDYEAARNHRQRRQLAAERLEFPFHRARAGQQEIIDRAGLAVAQREHLLVQAPTGLGKTAAVLFPVLREALARDLRVFVLTAKNTQQSMANRVIDVLNRERAFRALHLRAKARMCANDEIICHEDYCEYARDYYVKLQRSQLVPRLLEDHSLLKPDDVYAASKGTRVCPFEVSLELGRQVQVVVGDYNYALDPFVRLTDFHGDADLSGTVLVVDEIHNLIDRGRGYYSPELTAKSCRDAASGLRAVGRGAEGGPIERLRELCADLEELIRTGVDGQLDRPHRNAVAEGAPPEDELWRLRPAFDRGFVDYLEFRRDTRSFAANDAFVDLYFKLLRFLNTLQLACSPKHAESFSFLFRRTAGEPGFSLLCKDASAFLATTINRCRSCIGLSATLQPFDFYRDLLGFDQARTSTLEVPSAFPAENRRIVVDTSVTTTYRTRENNYGPIAERLADFARSVPGNSMAIFPSYRFLAEVKERLPDCGRNLVVQQRTTSESRRQEVLDALTSPLAGDMLLLAVAGGVFSEGVDYPGDALLAVAVVGPCLPAVTVEQKLLQAYYDERFERGFEYAFVVPGMTRVVQAAGRLIRSADDRGVIALFDRRFLQRPYRKHLPAAWWPEFAEKTNTDLAGHPATAAVAFFDR